MEIRIATRKSELALWQANHVARKLEALPGVVVPPLPEKKLTGKFGEEFVEKRRSMLEIFLNRCLLHPLVSCAERFSTFLTWNEGIRAAVHARAASFVLPPMPPDEFSRSPCCNFWVTTTTPFGHGTAPAGVPYPN